jgi:hypothetical protein
MGDPQAKTGIRPVDETKKIIFPIIDIVRFKVNVL